MKYSYAIKNVDWFSFIFVLLIQCLLNRKNIIFVRVKDTPKIKLVKV